MNNAINHSAVRRAAEIVANAHCLMINAGAGIGVDSGLPDFRGDEGFWRAYPALRKVGLSFTEIACPRAFETDPELAWGFYGHRLQLYRSTVPHAGFGILKGWTDAIQRPSRIFTSNVDGQFSRGGFGEAQIHECHGSIHHLQCLNDCCGDVWPADDFLPEIDFESCRLLNDLPECPRCGGVARPNVLMFGDWSWSSVRADRQLAMQEKWLDEVAAAHERIAVIEIGAGTAIPSVRRFTHHLANASRAAVVRINPDDCAVAPRLGVGIPVTALEALRAIDSAM